ncbi:glycosyltransferase family 4 protein [Paracoccus aestuariivivens]|uniref:Glycosyltransferase n=1 Tax=Paracoccus aestuariivivens TaxID=1820333 RepID=A0A6L6J797_9RHOB|nr:glycosyltransferase family 4 protein [Paracoccus aestuariivivens]MTH77820.1 glycosyltransferase [Paracoccus aestuariivivens]
MTLRIGYVVNTYPRPSHSFIRREIAALEAEGIEVHRFSMRGDSDALTDPEDLAEHARTERILEAGGSALLNSVLQRAKSNKGQIGSALALARKRAAAGESSLARQLIYLAEGGRIAARARGLNLSHLHAHFGTNSTRVAAYARLLGGPTFSFTVHGPEEFDSPAHLDLSGKLALSDFCVTVSSFGRSQMQRWAAPNDLDKIHVVHCGLDFSRQPAPLPQLPRPFRMVAVGRFAEQKGFGLLIRAFIQAIRRDPTLRLSLVGDGELRPQIESLIAAERIAHAVDLLGWQDESGVRAAMDNAHVLVTPSFAEGLPVVIMEAMARARPVISTYIAGIPELVRPDLEGWLVPAGDATALADAMISASNCDEATLERMGASALARVNERHDISNSARKLRELFTRAIG